MSRWIMRVQVALSQAALSACLVISVIGVFAARYARNVALANGEQWAQWKQDSDYGAFRTHTVSRSQFHTESPTRRIFLEDLPAVSDREKIMSALPAGRTYEVLVSGGAACRLRNDVYSPVRDGYVVYLFEMRYRRSIEINDGHKIVERRTYDSVRMAKILSPVSVRLKLDPPEAHRLDSLDFPEPGAGIVVGPIRPVAEAILQNGAATIADCPTSRAFLEQDILSGKSVRLTYIDGVGVSLIEPLGWTLTKPVAAHLFSQAVLPPPLPTFESLGSTSTGSTLLPAQLAAFVDPTQFLSNAHEIAIRKTPGVTKRGEAYELSLVPRARSPKAQFADSEYRLSSVIPLGCLQYDPDRKIIAVAAIEWPLDALDIPGDRLFFEADSHERAVLTVRYRCRAY